MSAPLTREQATEKVVREIMRDPARLVKTVVAAVVAQDHLDHDSLAFELLWEATTK